MQVLHFKGIPVNSDASIQEIDVRVNSRAGNIEPDNHLIPCIEPVEDLPVKRCAIAQYCASLYAPQAHPEAYPLNSSQELDLVYK